MILIVVVILLLFGGKKIPELMRGIGKGLRDFNDEKSATIKKSESSVPPAGNMQP